MKLIRTIYTIFATMCLGVILLIPILNLYLLRLVILQETGIKVNYWQRPLGQIVSYGCAHKKSEN